MAAIRSGASTLPVGFAGELTTMARVRGVSRSRIASGRYWKPSASLTSTSTVTPSA